MKEAISKISGIENNVSKISAIEKDMIEMKEKVTKMETQMSFVLALLTNINNKLPA
jgi:hypothetical protein